MKKGFTLIELLVVIAIIAVLTAIALPNYLGIRQRANDSKKKQELAQIKNALRLYYADYQKYPASADSFRKIAGCGQNGTDTCPTCTGYDFSAGGSNGCDKIYMKKFTDFLPDNANSLGWNYRSDGSDNFCLGITLDNTGDSEISGSQARCTSYSGCNNTNSYVVCAD